MGGSHVKCLASGHRQHVAFESGPKLTPGQMVKQVLQITAGWRFDAVSIGYPGVVRGGEPAKEPYNLGRGWVGFDFRAAFQRPVRILNDAAMQALGGYQGGKMLFLGLGTGLGSALIVDGVIVAMELGHLHYSNRYNYEDYVGEQGRERLGEERWHAMVSAVVRGLRKALLPDDVVLGGGNVKKLKRLPPQTRRGDNFNAFVGGFRLWQQGRSRKGRHERAR